MNEDSSTSSIPLMPARPPPPQIIVEELTEDDEYVYVDETPPCETLLSVDGTWLNSTARRNRNSYRSDPQLE